MSSVRVKRPGRGRKGVSGSTGQGWCVRVSKAVSPGLRSRGSALQAVRSVCRLFGLRTGRKETLYSGFPLQITPGEIVAVVGPSGAGKSVLLREVSRSVPQSIFLDVPGVARTGKPPVALLDGSLAERLSLLSRCGLAEARVMTTPARCLSGGQQYRLALAIAIAKAQRTDGGVLVLADEFGAALDDTTAVVLCRKVRKLINGSPLALLVATPRTDGALLEALQADTIIIKPLGEEAQVKRREQGEYPAPGGVHWPVERGKIGDYRALARFHYLTGPPAAHKRVYVVRVPDAQRNLSDPLVAGVLVVSPPLMHCRGRNGALPMRYTRRDRLDSMRCLNAEIEAISRVVVHPAFRGCGLAVKLVRHALATAQTPFVEALAVMGAINPFFERAGMYSFGAVQGRRRYVYYLGARSPHVHRRRSKRQ